MTRKTLYMETTEVPASSSAAEICSELVRGGASQINTEYKDGRVVGLRWVMRVTGRDLIYSMPARVEPVFKILLKRAEQSSRWWGSVEQKKVLHEKAERIAWRQLLKMGTSSTSNDRVGDG